MFKSQQSKPEEFLSFKTHDDQYHHQQQLPSYYSATEAPQHFQSSGTSLASMGGGYRLNASSSHPPPPLHHGHEELPFVQQYQQQLPYTAATFFQQPEQQQSFMYFEPTAQVMMPPHDVLFGCPRPMYDDDSQTTMATPSTTPPLSRPPMVQFMPVMNDRSMLVRNDDHHIVPLVPPKERHNVDSLFNSGRSKSRNSISTVTQCEIFGPQNAAPQARETQWLPPSSSLSTTADSQTVNNGSNPLDGTTESQQLIHRRKKASSEHHRHHHYKNRGSAKPPNPSGAAAAGCRMPLITRGASHGRDAESNSSCPNSSSCVGAVNGAIGGGETAVRNKSTDKAFTAPTMIRSSPLKANPQGTNTLKPNPLKSNALPSDRPITASEVMSLIKESATNEKALELVMKANETNLSYIRSASSAAGAGMRLKMSGNLDAEEVANEQIAFADEAKAREIMKRLNPRIKDEEKLFNILKDYVNGKEIDWNVIRSDCCCEATANDASTTTMLIPVNNNKTTAGESALSCDSGSVRGKRVGGNRCEGGFHMSHQFSMRFAHNGGKTDYMVVKIIESPVVLAVSRLFEEQECVDIVTIGCSSCSVGKDDSAQWPDSKTSFMKLRLEDNIRTYYIPNDDDGYSTSAAHEDALSIHRHCKAVYIRFEDYVKQPIYPFLKSLQLRAAAMCKCMNPNFQITGIAIERYEKYDLASFLHFSNQRQGAVIVFLSNGSTRTGGALTFPLAGIELIPKQGMAVFVPSIFSDTLLNENGPIPDPRTELAISKVTDDHAVIYYAVFYVSLPPSTHQ